MSIGMRLLAWTDLRRWLACVADVSALGRRALGEFDCRAAWLALDEVGGGAVRHCAKVGRRVGQAAHLLAQRERTLVRHCDGVILCALQRCHSGLSDRVAGSRSDMVSSRWR